ncbi:MAG TPA: TetR/AcrR family transcriptional regulator [Rhizobacter sp.]|nr:TetR/AcrR family transcriptional regulator [Rhizobacter sp.]
MTTTHGDGMTILKETGDKPETQRATLRCTQVLDAAQECFRRDGFHGASMAEISKAAGMSAGHIYYFDSKEAIIDAIVQRGLDELLIRFDHFLSEPDVLAAFVAGLDRSVSVLTEPGAVALKVEIFAEAARNPKIAAAVQRADEVRRKHLVEILRMARAGAPDAASDADIATRVEMLSAIFHGLGLRALANPGLDKKALIAMLRRVVTQVICF